MRNTTQRTRRAIALGLAAAALGGGLTLGSSGAAVAQPIPPSGPNQSNNNPPAGVFGSQAQHQPAPHDMTRGIGYWYDQQWPNWHNIGDRQWFPGHPVRDARTGQTVQTIIYTGGRYQDYDGRLRAFMNAGLAGTSSIGYRGTFQEYNTTVYTGTQNSNVPRRDARRIVRALTTGDVWWTNDHYSTFHYLGRL
ncbi:hypothetical protein [Streptomyces hawaiiensis]|jgi:hypothetical protein|uniref:hypothetical protein n=1 Tax=Streptomyces hawaiiensis TaxID=67305 RepID=UPI0036506091